MAYRAEKERIQIERIDEHTWQIPKKPGMNVPGRVYADAELVKKMQTDRTLLQCANVAHLPGIEKWSITLPDGHEGYGFPIGGVAAIDAEQGVISPGGVGYDINCGVRLLTTNLTRKDVEPKLPQLLENTFQNIPSGLGSRGKVRLSISQLERAVTEGVRWAIENGFGWPEDEEYCEEKGRMENADPDKASNTAKSRGMPQLGSLGSGNHFLEIDLVDKIYNPDIARKFKVDRIGQVMVLIHTGSRGYGHQICSDYLRVMAQAVRKYNISLPDRELACAPISSKEAQDYFDAMATAVNFAFTNRQMITHWTRQAFQKTFNQTAEDLNLHLIYDVAHNIAKRETHRIDGKPTKVYVHRKGATRAFGPREPDIPQEYRDTGSPVILPGAMSTASYLMVGTEKAMEITFGSSAHGAGREMSRKAATQRFRGNEIKQSMARQGILVLTDSLRGLAEEAGAAYKDIDRVAEVTDATGIAKRVARLVPIGVVKG